jgi:L-fucose isomerase-like protein
LRHEGLEGYHAHNFDELFNLGKLLNARKAFRNSKMLYVTNFPYQYPWGCTSSAVVNMDKIKDHYGFDYKFVDYEEFFGDMDKLVKDKKMAKIRKETALEMLKNASSSNMTLEYIEKSLDFYFNTLATMDKYGCNAFTIECHELCSSLNPWNRKFTPCLTHALLKDRGLPAACEGDVNALMAMMVQMYLSDKSVYMGNPFFNYDKNTLRLKHSNCGLKMNGFDNPDTSYDIHSFAESGFGVTLRHDFKKNIGSECTVARFDPSGMKVLVTKGDIKTGIGNEGFGCEQSVTLGISDCYEFWRSSQNYGHHFSLVYGDYTRQIRDLGEMMDFEVEMIV